MDAHDALTFVHKTKIYLNKSFFIVSEVLPKRVRLTFVLDLHVQLLHPRTDSSDLLLLLNMQNTNSVSVHEPSDSISQVSSCFMLQLDGLMKPDVPQTNRTRRFDCGQKDNVNSEETSPELQLVRSNKSQEESVGSPGTSLRSSS